MNMKITSATPLIVTTLLAAAVIGLGAVWPTAASPNCHTVSQADLHRLGSVRFTDTAHHTSLLIQLDPLARDAGAFSYIASTSSRYRGGPAQGLHPAANSQDPLVCAGLLDLRYSGFATLTQQLKKGTSETSSLVQVTMTAVIEVRRQGASIDFRDASNQLNFITLTQPPDDATHAAQAYNQNAIAQNWKAMYRQMASSTLQGMTEAQFTQAMTKATQRTGIITAVTITSPPRIGTTPDGITFYIVDEQVTVRLHNNIQVVNVGSVFVLEDGQWKFWFSKTL